MFLALLLVLIQSHRYNKRRNIPINSKPQFDVGDWWTDTNGTFIQAHGGKIEFIENYNCFNNATKGCWLWCGEDDLHNTGSYGVKCYASTNLYVWENKGRALFAHNMIPVRTNGLGNGIVNNMDNLRELKRRANLPKKGIRFTKGNDISDEDIDKARNFLKAYVTETDKDGNFVKFDEQSLLQAFVYLYEEYTVISRPKFLYNRKYNNYVIIFHSDGPRESDLVKWVKEGTPLPFKYGIEYNAMMGFAVSDSPFGPYKLVNVQRMHWVKGWHDYDPGMARDMGTYVDYNSEDSEDVAYVLYSSENNEYLYMSRLDDTFTTWSKVQGEAQDGIDFKARVIGETTWREAPAIFRHKGYYYLMTSGTTGWSWNAAKYHRSTMLFGPYEDMGNPCEGDGSDRTFDSQPTYIIRYNAKKGQFIYLGDRFFRDDLFQSRYVLLPIELDDTNHKIKLHYTEHWSLDDVFSSNSESEDKK